MRTKYVCLLIVLSGILLATGCNKQSEDDADNVKIIHTRGMKTIYNMTRSDFRSNPLADSTSAIAAEIGDILFCNFYDKEGESYMHIFQYSGETDEVLVAKADPIYPFLTNINGGDYTISLVDSTAWKWLENAGKDQLSKLNAALIDHSMKDAQLAILRNISKEKPDINFALFSDGEELYFDDLFSTFTPQWISLSAVRTLSGKQLSLLSDVKSMSFENSDGYTQYFNGLPQLTHLRISNSHWKRLNQYRLPENIKSLYFKDCSINDIRTLDGFKEIEALGFAGCAHLLDIRPVKGMKNLRWLALPPNIDQAQFDSLIPALTSLQVLELIGCDSLTNIDAVKQLPKLKSLTIQCSKIDPVDIPAIDNLQLLVIGAENDSISNNRVLALQQKFPDATVVPGSGYCLGSGWLLLLVPLVVLMMLAFRRLKPALNR